MKQAKTFTPREIKTLFAHVQTRRHGVRDRAILSLSFYAGLRAHEIASLRMENILGPGGRVLTEVLLSPCQTKGRQSRKVFISERLRKELEAYVKSIAPCASGGGRVRQGGVIY